MKTNHEPQNQSGFTIVELVVGIVLIGVVIVVITAMIQLLLQMNSSTHNTVLTTSLVQNKVEGMRSAGFNALGDNGTSVNFSSEMPSSLPRPKSAKYTITIDPAKPAEKVVVFDIETGGKHRYYKTIIGEFGVGQY